MSYLVLARKWRPGNFDQVVGQGHVLRTLSHALDNDRLHHAYLFTGTRGIGKTSIARILAKALNCEQGVSSNPCNACTACTQVNEGSYIDLIEIDAASKTKVEDTRTLLEGVPYKPTAGRFKIFLFDEIHMLSGHSFNAFLKTLEEPPAHVKFLMATTDPDKLPVTILSRCIQFNLRAMDAEEISEQLSHILEQEKVEFEQGAVNAIAQLADGSLRDALSIVDQAISYSEGNLKEAAVRDMLGMISANFLHPLLKAVASGQGDEILSIVDKMFELSINIRSVLDDLLLKLHELGLHKSEPNMIEKRAKDVTQLRELSHLMSAEEIQLYYQIGLLGKRDLEFAPTPRVGLEMILLRMIAFHPASMPTRSIPQTKQPSSSPSTQSSPISASTKDVSTAPTEKPVQDINNAEDWLAFVRGCTELKAMTKQFASILSFESRSGNTISLRVPVDASAVNKREGNHKKLEEIISASLGKPIEIIVTQAQANTESLHQREARIHAERTTEAIEQIESEEVPQLLKQEFGATADVDSFRFADEKPN